MNTNILLLINVIEASLRASQELAAMLQRAQMENRDVTDEEVNNLKTGNDLLSQELIKRLGG